MKKRLDIWTIALIIVGGVLIILTPFFPEEWLLFSFAGIREAQVRGYFRRLFK